MPLLLYYLSGSPPARSVDLVIHALGLTAEYKIVNLLEKEQYTPEFEKINPLHTIPAINDNGFILWESRAIMTYLVSKYAKDDSLYPKDLQKRAIVDQKLHFSNDVFYIIRFISKEVVYNKKKDIPDILLEKLKETQENVEKLLTGQQFMAGDTLTLADYSLITLMDALDVYSPMLDKFPLTSAWIGRCKTVMKDFDKVNEEGVNMLRTIITKHLSG